MHVNEYTEGARVPVKPSALMLVDARHRVGAVGQEPWRGAAHALHLRARTVNARNPCLRPRAPFRRRPFSDFKSCGKFVALVRSTFRSCAEQKPSAKGLGRMTCLSLIWRISRLIHPRAHTVTRTIRTSEGRRAVTFAQEIGMTTANNRQERGRKTGRLSGMIPY